MVGDAVVFHTIIPVVGLGIVELSPIPVRGTFGKRNPRWALDASLKSNIAGLVVGDPLRFIAILPDWEKTADDALEQSKNIATLK
jgi:hypothetical protein